jgi:two-component system KDP operon response regulator KdpE
VTKPFAMNELLARLRAAVRRAEPSQAEEPVVVAGELRIDLARRQVSRAGAEVRLSPTEWALLEVLVRNRGRLVDRKLLLHEVWGPAYSTETNYLRVYTAQLRRKLEKDPSQPRHILTHPGAGYRFEE